jgi:hypothetical protein
MATRNEQNPTGSRRLFEPYGMEHLGTEAGWKSKVKNIGKGPDGKSERKPRARQCFRPPV